MEKFKTAHQMMHQPRDEFRGLSFDQVLESIQIDLAHHRDCIHQINHKLAYTPSLSLEECSRLANLRNEHKRACTRIESRKRSLLFGDSKR